ncbi:DUF4331 domain-containing protein [Lysobacter korlensis]|uniref:DUF4331 domain-containing protein n=1 Tax=Lysobacter korlensis TaxID=553636 RepID=A0ABV6RQ48_9GAMM
MTAFIEAVVLVFPLGLFPHRMPPHSKKQGVLPMKRTAIAVALAGLVIGGAAIGSSHREAPKISEMPTVDNTDLYMFRSYEAGRENYVTLIANFRPFQEPWGGPIYYPLNEEGLYSIHVDSNGDAYSDTSFHFRFSNNYRGLTVPVGGKDIAVPIINIGQFGGDAEPEPTQNRVESYAFASVHKGKVTLARNLANGKNFFYKPIDNIGQKSIVPDYETYARNHIYPVAIEGCAGESRVFVGQRKESFVVNVGEIFDLINYDPVQPRDGERNVLDDSNITTIALEVPIACLTTSGSPIIGAWTTASLKKNEGKGVSYKQVSRLGNPLVNEVVIGMPDKDKFNSVSPRRDASLFAKYVQFPTLPKLIETLFPVKAPNVFPRTDLVAVFLTGIPGLNKPESVVPAEMMRLNTSIAPVPASQQDSLGVIAGDTAGFPNGRRPGDDVVDIELRVLMGALLTDEQAPSRTLPYTDGALVTATQFQDKFPYLNTPLPGSPNEARDEDDIDNNPAGG